jgi:hypothetical protein
MPDKKKVVVVSALYQVAVMGNNAAPWAYTEMSFTPDYQFRVQGARDCNVALVPIPEVTPGDSKAWADTHRVSAEVKKEIEVVPIDDAVFGSFGTDMQALVVKLGLYTPDAEGN